MRKYLITLAFTFITLGSTLHAKELKLPAKESYVSMTLPSRWKLKQDDTGVKVISSDKHVNLSIEALDTATTDVQARMAKQVQELVATGVVIDAATAKQEKATLAGCEMVEASWDATLKEAGPMKVSVSILHLPNKKALCMVYWATLAGEQRNSAALAAMLMSIKVLN